MALFGGGGVVPLSSKLFPSGNKFKSFEEKERLEAAQQDVRRFLRDNPEVQREQLGGDIFAQAKLINDPRRSADFVSGIIARNRARQVAGQRGIRANILTSPLGLARNAGAGGTV